MYAGAPVSTAPSTTFERAGHPYTQALIAAVPQIGDERA
jgi:ABC-type dipeptide/oligopeptide/nickel transport system ATPase component